MIYRFLKTTTMLCALTLCAGSLSSTTAWAEKGGNGKKNHQARYEEGYEYRNDDHKNALLSIKITNSDRDIIRSFIGQDYQRKCPPGLAKKNNGCLPPGQAKKYQIGGVLPEGLQYSKLPRGLRDLLSPAPSGYQYVQVDKDVLLISEAGKKVIDAVTLLSAVGQ